MLEEVSFLSAIGISLPIHHSLHGTARERLPITLKIAIRAVSSDQVDEKREGISGRDRDRTGDPLLAKPDNRLQQLFLFSLTTNVYNKSGNLFFAQR
jgi:hypothetical protein